MNSNEMDQNGGNSDDMSLEQPVSLNSYTKGVYGDPVKLPRVGNQYQVEIPALMSLSEYRSYTRDPLEDENKGGPNDFVMGLPISIIWVNQEVRPEKDRKVNFLNDSKSSRPFEHNVELVDEVVKKTDEIKGFLAPGSCGDSWSETDKASFLLGLYIFGNNFFQVKKFVEAQNMGEILFCYYGKFYKTSEKQRWSVWRRRGKTRKCVPGKKLFEGLRHQELLSRLIRGLPKELQNAVLQLSKFFNDGKTQLEEYVFTLKNLVGLISLIDAIGIGRGRKDLTGPSMPICPEVPNGKACSSLRPDEIIKILTGDYRLSKARSTDFFWEAVWPILVNKGWKKTESSSHNFASSSKQSHLFFAPGVPRSSSRRDLIKGEQYFDSVPDVLTFVASNPGILDFDEKEDEEQEDGNDDFLERDTDLMAFTVVDTSLTNGKMEEVGDLRDLPVEVSRNSVSQSAEVSTDESDYAYPMPVEEDNGNANKLTRARSENPNAGNAHIAPVRKRRRRLTACSSEASGQGLVNLTSPSSDTPNISENVCSIESVEERAQVNEPNDRPLFDLNLPAEEVDFDCFDFLTEVADPQNTPAEHAEPMAGAEPVTAEEEEVNLNSRRHSLRNRLPTTRALEAIAHGFMSVNTRRGRGESSRSRSRSSQEEGRGSGLGTRDAANGTTSSISGNGEF